MKNPTISRMSSRTIGAGFFMAVASLVMFAAPSQAEACFRYDNTSFTYIEVSIGSFPLAGNGWSSSQIGPGLYESTRSVTMEEAWASVSMDSGGWCGDIEPSLDPLVDIDATPRSIDYGDSSRLSWDTANVTACSIDQGIGSVTPNAAGAVDVSPTSDTTYTITCTYTTSGLEGTRTDSVTVAVNPPPPALATCAASPDDTIINIPVTWEGFASDDSGSSERVWDSVGGSTVTKICSGGTNTRAFQNTCPDGVYDGASCSGYDIGYRCKVSADQDFCDVDGGTVYGSTQSYSCTATGTSGVTHSYSWSGTDGLSGSTKQVSKTYTTGGTKYGTVSVSSSVGTSSATCSVNVTAPSAISVDLTATPTSINSGASSILSWVTTNADVCTSDDFDTGGNTSGSVKVFPPESKLYTILCTKEGLGASGTYKYYDSDISDLSCPITDPNKVYSGLPNCPVNPEGKACTGPCKKNTVTEYPGVCAVDTDIYTCEYSQGTPTQTATDSASVTVNSLLPNLQAGSVTPTSAAFGTARSFSATISNAGSLGTGAGFTALWQRANDASGTGAVDVGTSAVSMIAAGGNVTTSRSITLPPRANPWYLRVCADKTSSANAGVITESNEGDNCGAWTQITDSGCTGPGCGGSDGLTCQVSDSTPDLNQQVTFTAVPSGSVNGPYTWTSSGGTGPNSNSTTITRTYSVAGPYTMQVSSDGQNATCSVNVNGPACTATPELTLTATPNRVRPDSQTFQVTWEVENTDATTCRLTGTNGYDSGPVSPSSCVIPSRTITQGPIATQTIYTLRCGLEEETAIVNVIPTFEEF